VNVLGILIPVALLLGLAGLAAFFWASSSGQFDDMDGAALRILIDDGEAPASAPEPAE
jgi:cbb3-type cytochrome oxidase maturation protein